MSSILDTLLVATQNETPREIAKEKPARKLKLTTFAFERAYKYAELACKVAGRSVECGGYLIAPITSEDGIAWDSYLSGGQIGQGALYTLNGDDVIRANNALRGEGYKIIGWWHSHGMMNTFFSGTDVEGQQMCLNKTAAYNHFTESRERNLKNLESRVENGTLILEDKDNSTRCEIPLQDGQQAPEIRSMKIVEEKKIGYTYGLVVNANKSHPEPYSEIATREFSDGTKKSRDQSEVVELDVVPVSEYYMLDEARMEEEVKSKVSLEPAFSMPSIEFAPRKWLKRFWNGYDEEPVEERNPRNGNKVKHVESEQPKQELAAQTNEDLVAIVDGDSHPFIGQPKEDRR